MRYINTIWATLFCTAVVIDSWYHFASDTKANTFLTVVSAAGIALAIVNGLIWLDTN